MGKIILIVDDSASIRKTVAFILQDQGYTVLEAENGKKGLEMLSTNTCHLVISDINMPEMNGIELTQQIRTLAEYKYLPILILTTESDVSKMEEGKKAGATGWIVKPFVTEKLISVVAKVLG